jgi:excisionase family DNA binding protein
MTVYRLINAGQLSAVRIGRSFRLRQEDLDQFLDSQVIRAG